MSEAVSKHRRAADRQASKDAVSYTAIYPTGSKDTILLSGLFGQDTLTDARADNGNARPLAVINSIKQDTVGTMGGTEMQLSAGSSGFWGLGIFEVGSGVSPNGWARS